MAEIQVLDPNTINQIAAGEVVDRPSSVVKELMENAIDAGATAVTVEIKEGGIPFIRITDNGCGIPKDEVKLAFLRHSTSKIRTAMDLITVGSLGFRGEALSSIAAVSQVELITKPPQALTGICYSIEGGEEKSMEEIGAPDGTTFLVRNLFYNVPARRKFLKSSMTEGNYINELVEKMALSHPEVSIRFINNGTNKLYTTGNHKLKDLIYTVYGREIASNLIPIHAEVPGITIDGFLGKPVISRGNRSFENYFINGRYVKSGLIAKSIETAYKPFMMQHRYPFTVLHIQVEQESIDVNVHPAKMELRFKDEPQIYETLVEQLSAALKGKEFIPEIELVKQKEVFTKSAAEEKTEKIKERPPEPFEKKRIEAETLKQLASFGKERQNREREKNFQKQEHKKEQTAPYCPPSPSDSPDKKKTDASSVQRNLMQAEKTQIEEMLQIKQSQKKEVPEETERAQPEEIQAKSCLKAENGSMNQPQKMQEPPKKLSESDTHEQLTFFSEPLLSKEARKNHRLIGQLFDTYWLIQYEDKLFIIDQHAAHEKVLYERTIRSWKNKEFTSQMISPPWIVSLTTKEEAVLNQYQSIFRELGYEIAPFGGKEYAISAIPGNLFGVSEKEMFIELLSGLEENPSWGSKAQASELITEKVASLSCKAAVKGNHAMSVPEADALIDELLQLENPYACPHGRPTIISMSKYEVEKKFKRIV